MASNYWNIDSANGNELTAGIQLEHEARKIAQRMANERGEAVTLYQPGGESEEIEPEAYAPHPVLVRET